MVALGFIHNLIRRHPSCVVLLHRPNVTGNHAGLVPPLALFLALERSRPPPCLELSLVVSQVIAPGQIPFRVAIQVSRSRFATVTPEGLLLHSPSPQVSCACHLGMSSWRTDFPFACSWLFSPCVHLSLLTMATRILLPHNRRERLLLVAGEYDSETEGVLADLLYVHDQGKTLTSRIVTIQHKATPSIALYGRWRH